MKQALGKIGLKARRSLSHAASSMALRVAAWTAKNVLMTPGSICDVTDVAVVNIVAFFVLKDTQWDLCGSFLRNLIDAFGNRPGLFVFKESAVGNLLPTCAIVVPGGPEASASAGTAGSGSGRDVFATLEAKALAGFKVLEDWVRVEPGKAWEAKKMYLVNPFSLHEKVKRTDAIPCFPLNEYQDEVVKWRVSMLRRLFKWIGAISICISIEDSQSDSDAGLLRNQGVDRTKDAVFNQEMDSQSNVPIAAVVDAYFAITKGMVSTIGDDELMGANRPSGVIEWTEKETWVRTSGSALGTIGVDVCGASWSGTLETAHNHGLSRSLSVKLTLTTSATVRAVMARLIAQATVFEPLRVQVVHARELISQVAAERRCHEASIRELLAARATGRANEEVRPEDIKQTAIVSVTDRVSGILIGPVRSGKSSLLFTLRILLGLIELDPTKLQLAQVEALLKKPVSLNVNSAAAMQRPSANVHTYEMTSAFSDSAKLHLEDTPGFELVEGERDRTWATVWRYVEQNNIQGQLVGVANVLLVFDVTLVAKAFYQNDESAQAPTMAYLDKLAREFANRGAKLEDVVLVGTHGGRLANKRGWDKFVRVVDQNYGCSFNVVVESFTKDEIRGITAGNLLDTWTALRKKFIEEEARYNGVTRGQVFGDLLAGFLEDLLRRAEAAEEMLYFDALNGEEDAQ